MCPTTVNSEQPNIHRMHIICDITIGLFSILSMLCMAGWMDVRLHAPALLSFVCFCWFFVYNIHSMPPIINNNWTAVHNI